MVSQVISHYRIISKLGAGGMGEVFLAEDTRLGRKVAIKLLPARSTEDVIAKKRLIKEARAAATLDHPNICSIYEVNEEGGLPFIVMQYIEGSTLSKILKTSHLDLDKAVDIAEQVAEALVEAHSHDIVHRDIKPQNILITPRQQVKVLDFGLAKILQREMVQDRRIDGSLSLTESGVAVGTVSYMSPEQVKGEEVDNRSDLFSLGVVLYESVVGRPPFSGSNSVDICANVIHADPRPASQLNPRVPSALDDVIVKALAKNRDKRYQSATEMLADLRQLHQALRATSEAPTAILAPQERLGRRVASTIARLSEKRAFIAVVVTSLLVLAIIAVLLTTLRESRSNQPASFWYEKGTAALREGAYYQASKELDQAVELDDALALAHARLAEAYAEMDYADSAKEELLKAMMHSGGLNKPEATYLEAIGATVLREFPRAIEGYRQLVEQAADADKPSLYVDLGRALEKSEDLDNARKSYLRATELDPQSATAFLRLAVLYGRDQDTPNATAAFDKAQKLYEIASNQEGVTEVLYQRGTLFNRIDKLADARVQLDAALKNTELTGNKYQQIKTLLQLSSLYYYGEGDTELAKRYASDAIELAKANNIHNLATNGLIDLGAAVLSRGEFDDAEKYFKQALDSAQRDKLSRIEARAKLALASLNLQRDNPDPAVTYCNEAIGFYEPSGYRKETSIALSMLGRANRLKGNYKDAFSSFAKQLDLAQKLGDLSQQAASHDDLGILLGVAQERYPDALAHLDESFKINESLKATYNAAYDLMYRGRLLWQLGRYDEARFSLRRALSIASRPEAGYKHLLAWVYLSQSQMSLSLGHLADAQAKAKKAFDLAANQYTDLTIQAKCVRALVQAKSGRPAVGKELGEEAVRIATDKNLNRELSSALLALSEVKLILNDQGASEAALRARSMFTSAEQKDSEWHALLIASRASELAGDKDKAIEYSSAASNLLSRLRDDWGADVFGHYSKRPDIATSRRQLEQILARAH